MFLRVCYLIANLPVHALRNHKPLKVVLLLRSQCVVLPDPFTQRIAGQDVVVEIITIEIPHQAREDLFQLLVSFLGRPMQHVHVPDFIIDPILDVPLL